MPRNLLYAQSGGVTAVINATAAGVIEAARERPDAIGSILAARNGIVGALTEDLIDTGPDPDASIAALRHTPGGAFGSCRYKLRGLDENRAEYDRLLEVFRAHDIGYFLYNGGGDSQDTSLKVAQLGQEANPPIVSIGVPKTVDNDLPGTDTCPGFGSVARYVAISIREAAFDVASMAATSTRVFILEVMGRHAGWIAAASGLAAEGPGQAPHLIVLPEVPFDRARVMARIAASIEQYGHCALVVSEGARYADGRFVADQGAVDSFGHAQLGGAGPAVAAMVRDDLGEKVHYAVSDYLQRAARHIASATDVDQAYAVGHAAVEMAIAGRTGHMASIVRTNDNPYRWTVGETDLATVANVERGLPADYISEDGFGITAACRAYLAPLIEGDAPPPYVGGLPDYVRLLNTPVAKRLPPFELPKR